MLPEKVKLDPKDATALRELGDRQKSVQQFVQMVSEQGERRLQKLQHDTGDFWKMAQEKYNLDLQHINYTLDNDGEHIIPISMRLV